MSPNGGAEALCEYEDVSRMERVVTKIHLNTYSVLTHNTIIKWHNFEFLSIQIYLHNSLTSFGRRYVLMQSVQLEFLLLEMRYGDTKHTLILLYTI